MKAVWNIADLRRLARARLPQVVWDYIEGGAEDEITSRANREAFAALRFAPRVLVNTSQRSLKTTLLGRQYDAPFGIAPMGATGLVWHGADIKLARAARAANLPFALSTHAFATPASVARESGCAPWFQLYMSPERQVAREALVRAQEAGCDTLLLTADVPVGGNREYNDRNGFCIPFQLGLANVLDGMAHPRWLAQVFVRSRLYARAHETAPPGWSERRDVLDWRDFIWLRNAWHGKLLVKGVLTPEDAILAADLGADGIIISNHGGRQLDGAPSPMEVLPQITAAVKGRIAIIADSGFRRGSDIVKALALGADFVLVGRAALYGAAANGEKGVQRALQILCKEVDRTLALIGCRSIAELGPRFLLDGDREEAQTRVRKPRMATTGTLPPGVLPLRRREPPSSLLSEGPMRPS